MNNAGGKSDICTFHLVLGDDEEKEETEKEDREVDRQNTIDDDVIFDTQPSIPSSEPLLLPLLSASHLLCPCHTHDTKLDEKIVNNSVADRDEQEKRKRQESKETVDFNPLLTRLMELEDEAEVEKRQHGIVPLSTQYIEVSEERQREIEEYYDQEGDRDHGRRSKTGRQERQERLRVGKSTRAILVEAERDRGEQPVNEGTEREEQR